MIDIAGRTRRVDIITQNGGYKGGYVYMAAVWGRAGILPNLNGTLLDPVNTFADAFTIMELAKISNLYIIPQSSETNINLPSSFSGFNINGRNFAVDLNGKYVEHTHFLAGHISGLFSGAPHFEHCEATDLTGPGCFMFDTAIDGVFTNNANDSIWLLNGCYTKTPGSAAVTFDYGAGKTNIALMLRHHSGGMNLKNMAAGHKMTAEGFGQLIIDATCTGGAISVRGAWKVTDNSGGAVTITYDDSIGLLNTIDTKVDDIDTSAESAAKFAVTDALIAEISTGLINTTIATVVSQKEVTLTAGAPDDDAYLDCLVVVRDAVTSEQLSIDLCTGYTGATKTLKLLNDPVFTIAPPDKVSIVGDKSGLLTKLEGSNAIDFQYYITGGTTPMASVAVSIWNEAMTLFLGRVYTDENGQAETGLDAGTYKIVALKTATVFTVPETLVVDSNESVTYYGDTFVVPIPGDPLQCNVYIDLVDLGVAKVAGVEFTANLETGKAQKAGSTILKATPYTMTTDSNGRIIMPLAKGYVYKITSEALGKYDQTVQIDTTDKDTLILADYLNT